MMNIPSTALFLIGGLLSGVVEASVKHLGPGSSAGHRG
jgi:hypothetical protein